MSIDAVLLSKRFGEKQVLKDLSFTLPEAGVVEICGPSGGGKTTLLRLLAGLETPDGGEIRGLAGKRLSMVFQEDRLLMHQNALQNVRFASRVSEREALDVLEEMGLADSVQARASTLSGGMKRRVAIARAVCAGGDVLILDEPFKGLDEATRARVIDCILRRCGGMLILLVSHDRAEGEAMGAVMRLEIGGENS